MTPMYRIYAIRSTKGPKQYIGRTQRPLVLRYRNHLIAWRQWCDLHTYRITSSFELFDEYQPENCYIVELEQTECPTKAAEIERFYVENLLHTVNKNIPNRKFDEWVSANPTYQKNYRAAHKEDLSKYIREWYKRNKGYKQTYKAIRKYDITI